MKRPLASVVDEDGAERSEPKLPRTWQRLSAQYPEIAAAYDTLSEVCRQAGPLDPSTVALLKVAVSVGGGAARTVHSHTKKALRAGVDPEALRQVALVALPTIGLPAALDALRWVEESIREASSKARSCRRAFNELAPR